MENFTNSQIDISHLPQFESVEFHPISKSYLKKSIFQDLLLLCAATIGWIALYYFDLNPIITIIILVVLCLYFSFRFWNTFMLQKNYGFALREKDILFRRGYFVNKTTVVPFNRIQHASISRDILDKYLNIATLKIFTAGGSGSDIEIPGLSPELALQLKEAFAAKLTKNGL